MKVTILYTCGLLFAIAAGAAEMKKEVNLNGAWRFEIGDNPAYAGAAFDDAHWETIQAPARWEEQGFPGYDGMAWYRKRFSVPHALRDKKLYLDLGCIDDVDRTWVNGHLVNSSGRLPPEYETAYTTHRLYYIPAEFLQFDAANVVAVQVYDDFESGGIVSGDLGLYSRREVPELVVDLSGYWQFRTGDDPAWRLSETAQSGWDSLIVPLKWEVQGYPEYDGYAWYRRSVVIPAENRDTRLILALGKIDDVDEVWFNGERIGRTGHFPDAGEDIRNNDWWLQERYYTIPAERIHWGGENLIAVRTYDAWIDGGIYDGVVGIMTRTTWLRWRRAAENPLIEMLKKWFEPVE